MSFVAEGESGANEQSVQHPLNAADYPVDVDGVLGHATTTEVTSFETDRGLSADDSVGEHTWSALITTLSSSDTGKAVTGLQVR